MTRMYHTLLPIDERGVLRREYRLRMLVVLCFMLSLVCIFGIVSLLPTFTRILGVESRSKLELSILKKASQSSVVADIEKRLMINKSLIAPISTMLKESEISPLIQSIATSRGNVTISSFNISRITDGTITIGIQGLASTREDLLFFKTRLESLSVGNKVSLPVSQLAKSTNIQYSIQITTKLQ